MFDANAAGSVIRNLSVSKIEKLLLCPKNFELSYIHKIPQPNVWKMHAGNVVHEIIENAIRQFAVSGQYPDWKTMDDQYEPVWEAKQAETEGKSTFIGWQEDPKDPLEKLRPEYRTLIRVAREQVLPGLRPWMMEDGPAVEYRIDLELRSRVGPFPLIGYLDVLEASGILMDWKTTNEEVSARAKRTWLQFAAYSIWVWPLTGEEVVRCEKIFLVRGNGNPRVERVPFTMDPRHRDYFISVAARAWELIHHRIFYPNSETWLCKPDFCPFYQGCQGELGKHGTTKAAAPAQGAIA